MRTVASERSGGEFAVLRRRVDGLTGLPLRPLTARALLRSGLAELEASGEDGEAGLFGESASTLAAIGTPARGLSLLESDPGWALAASRRAGAAPVALEMASESPWWSAHAPRTQAALDALWRSSLAAALAARRLAREAGELNPDGVGRAALLHRLGLWALAAVDVNLLADWLELPNAARTAWERARFGCSLDALGADLAARWDAEPLVADACRLRDPRVSAVDDALAADPRGLAIVRRAVEIADRTPWRLTPHVETAHPRDASPTDPRVLMVMAEVQSRHAGAFTDNDATPLEMGAARAHARLARRTLALERKLAARERFIKTFVASDPSESPDLWADRVASACCEADDVAAARVVWAGEEHEPTPPEAARTLPVKAARSGVRLDLKVEHILLYDRGRPFATIVLRGDGTRPELDPLLRSAWEGWGRRVLERTRAEGRLDAALQAVAEHAEADETRLEEAKRAALAEFAAGAGHELNNPLAVIVGRAQLLLAREEDPDRARALEAIVGQARRTHRMLRDLMGCARPAQPRPRDCLPVEAARAAFRDLKPEAEARGVTLKGRLEESNQTFRADPDAFRAVAEILLRNAVEATPRGGTVSQRLTIDGDRLIWSVEDGGPGVTPEVARQMFDPFFCGRQAGRGLGLGLPRAARLAELAGGRIDRHQTPGRGATFRVEWPLEPATGTS